MISPFPRNIFFALFLSVSVTRADDFKTVTGKEYKNATLTRVEPDGIVVKFSGGIVKIPFTDLSSTLKQKYHYDRDAAQKFVTDEYEQLKGPDEQAPAPAARPEENDEAVPKKMFIAVIVFVVCLIITIGAFIKKSYL